MSADTAPKASSDDIASGKGANGDVANRAFDRKMFLARTKGCDPATCRARDADQRGRRMKLVDVLVRPCSGCVR